MHSPKPATRGPDHPLAPQKLHAQNCGLIGILALPMNPQRPTATLLDKNGNEPKTISDMAINAVDFVDINAKGWITWADTRGGSTF